MPSLSRTVNDQQSTVNNKAKRGFTIVELMIVIAIIGILAGITAVVMPNRLKQARDARRKSDLNQVKKIMEDAKGDCKGAAYYLIPPLGTFPRVTHPSATGLAS